MIKLPKGRIKGTRKDPKTIILYSKPKTGKSTILSELDNCLTIDLEQGMEYLDSQKIDVIKEAKEAGKLPIVVVSEIIKTIREANKQNGGFVYQRIALDTLSALEEIVKPLAKNMYVNTPQ